MKKIFLILIALISLNGASNVFAIQMRLTFESLPGRDSDYFYLDGEYISNADWQLKYYYDTDYLTETPIGSTSEPMILQKVQATLIEYVYEGSVIYANDGVTIDTYIGNYDLNYFSAGENSPIIYKEVGSWPYGNADLTIVGSWTSGIDLISQPFESSIGMVQLPFDRSVKMTISNVPEPGTCSFLVLGFLGFIGAAWKKQNSAP